MAKNLMLQFKLLNIFLKNMNFYLFSHIALFYGQTLIILSLRGKMEADRRNLFIVL
jgi:hypothetical protein